MSSTDKEPANGAAGRAEHLETVVVEDELELTLVLSDWLTAPVRTCFTYRTNDPYAVHLLFHFEYQEPVPWVFARDLLTAGMSDRAGVADVTVRPTCDRSLTSLSLASPHGRVEVEAPTRSLATWLARTHQAVPAGHEDRHLDLDTQVERLLREPEPPPPTAEAEEEDTAGQRHDRHAPHGIECPRGEHARGGSTGSGERISRCGDRPTGRPRPSSTPARSRQQTNDTGHGPGTGCMP